ncbi:MAG: hypothetical protein MUF87_18190 [Anaerolineae bacterium]|jgi:hypothetical protein|nr:hypothetical protein [Anaerolineae bacterium]
MIRYINAFFKALWLTLRGQNIPRSPLQGWIEQTIPLTGAVIRAADAHGWEQTARKTHKLRIEGRDVSMETILTTVLFHAREEYPYLLKNQDQHSLLAIQSSNVNDVFWLSRLAESLTSAAIKGPLDALIAHLKAMPRMEGGIKKD